MKGLLVKDLRILWGAQKTTIAFLAIFEIWFICMGMEQMALVYTIMLTILTSIGTLNYDEFNHGMQFLFTLPFQRKEYVREKYLLGTLMAAAGAVLSFVAVFAYDMITKGSFEWMQSVMVFAAFLVGILLLSLSLPIQLKFGSEKGRIVTMLFYGVVGLIGAFVMITLQEFSVDGAELLAWFKGIWGVAVAVLGGALYLALIALSYYISVKIVEKKEL